MKFAFHTLTLLGLAMLLAACGKAPPAPEPVRAVRTLTVGSDTAGGSHEFAAEVRARTETRLGFRVGGKLVSRPAEVGQRVASGQVLARIDATDLQLGQAAAEAGVRSAQAGVALAQAEFERYAELREQGFISALELERRTTALQAQRSQLEQARALLGQQGNLAAYAALTATAAGVVTAVEAEVGAVLAAGTPVLRLAHDGPRDAVFSVPEDAVPALRALAGRPGALQVRPWGTSRMLPAMVREVAAAADPLTRTFAVKADLGAAPLELGQTLTVLLQQPLREGVTLLPLTAVMEHRGQTAVWLLDRDTMTVQVQAIEVAGADANAVVVSAGLSPGQSVVTAGVHTLTPGQKVKLYTVSQASAASGAAPAR